MCRISQAKIKFVQSLKHKKYRQEHNAYIIEGEKACQTAVETGNLPSFVIVRESLPDFVLPSWQIYSADHRTMKKLSSFDSPPNMLCVFPIPNERQINQASTKGNVILFLDRIQDPGNLGTIIRTADWYGLKSVILSKGCVDVYNSKVIQATMGSHLNIDIYYAEFEEVKDQLADRTFVGLDMHGDALNRLNLPTQLVIIVGNEGQGLSDSIKNELDIIASLPGHEHRLAESLNAGISVAISLDRLLGR